jgi:hypothetical protein
LQVFAQSFFFDLFLALELPGVNWTNGAKSESERVDPEIAIKLI